MKNFKFTYNEENTTNKTIIIKANDVYEAYTIFYNEYGNSVDVVKVENV